MNLIELEKILNKKGYIAKSFDKRSDLIPHILNLIEKDKTIGMGGSETVNELMIPQMLIERGQTVYSSRFIKDMSSEEIRQKANNSDYFLCSTNAITENGELVNIDGVCNRISAMCYGPKNVIFIVGKNKITKDIKSAIERIKTVACPKNAKRLNLSTPCALTGKCTNCNSPQRMCRGTLIFEYPPRTANFYIFLVNEDLGY